MYNLLFHSNYTKGSAGDARNACRQGKSGLRELNAVTLLEIAAAAEELNVVYRACASLAEGNNMIEFEVIMRAALHAFSLIALPDSGTHLLGNTPAITCGSFTHKLASSQINTNASWILSWS